MTAAEPRTDPWFKEHKGDLVRTVGSVWYCGDEECGCTEAQILNVYLNKVTCTSYVMEAVWVGPFHTDHEGGAEEELAAKRAELAVSDPALHDRIEWPD